MTTKVANAKTKRVKDEKVEGSGGNVFADLGFADALDLPPEVFG